MTIDAPLSMALDKEYGQCALMPYTWDGRVSDSGVENLTLVSDYNKKYPMDEDHCWSGISIENAENCWVRMVDFRHFAVAAKRGRGFFADACGIFGHGRAADDPAGCVE